MQVNFLLRTFESYFQWNLDQIEFSGATPAILQNSSVILFWNGSEEDTTEQIVIYAWSRKTNTLRRTV